MAELSLNHVGEQIQLTVTGVAVALSPPTYFEQSTRTTIPMMPSHALIYTDKAIRWRADGVDPNPDMGMYVPAGTTITWLDALTDYSGLISRVKFCKDAATVGNATLDVAYFT